MADAKAGRKTPFARLAALVRGSSSGGAARSGSSAAASPEAAVREGAQLLAAAAAAAGGTQLEPPAVFPPPPATPSDAGAAAASAVAASELTELTGAGAARTPAPTRTPKPQSEPNTRGLAAASATTTPGREPSQAGADSPRESLASLASPRALLPDGYSPQLHACLSGASGATSPRESRTLSPREVRARTAAARRVALSDLDYDLRQRRPSGLVPRLGLARVVAAAEGASSARDASPKDAGRSGWEAEHELPVALAQRRVRRAGTRAEAGPAAEPLPPPPLSRLWRGHAAADRATFGTSKVGSRAPAQGSSPPLPLLPRLLKPTLQRLQVGTALSSGADGGAAMPALRLLRFAPADPDWAGPPDWAALPDTPTSWVVGATPAPASGPRARAASLAPASPAGPFADPLFAPAAAQVDPLSALADTDRGVTDRTAADWTGSGEAAFGTDPLAALARSAGAGNEPDPLMALIATTSAGRAGEGAELAAIRVQVRRQVPAISHVAVDPLAALAALSDAPGPLPQQPPERVDASTSIIPRDPLVDVSTAVSLHAEARPDQM
ncbi:hypothetical protein T492DRAFT_833927 [Pavlovales sp. CCMP2436]|nr:hypothetical protein T492DRAFT_833927 [Pavlovales sp. CCMP2436]